MKRKRQKNIKTNSPARQRLIALIGIFIFKCPSSGNLQADHIVEMFTSIRGVLIIELESV